MTVANIETIGSSEYLLALALGRTQENFLVIKFLCKVGFYMRWPSPGCGRVLTGGREYCILCPDDRDLPHIRPRKGHKPDR